MASHMSVQTNLYRCNMRYAVGNCRFVSPLSKELSDASISDKNDKVKEETSKISDADATVGGPTTWGHCLWLPWKLFLRTQVCPRSVGGRFMGSGRQGHPNGADRRLTLTYDGPMAT